ncbi:MAG TPA: hypothetical protein VMT53_03380 [Terriglobales bacterium]|nr:hypothetical protein [Terriglobales bacterium]
MYGPMRALLLIALLLSVADLIGCGSGDSVTGSGPRLGDGSNNAMLQGQYAFAFSGQDANGPFSEVGSFTADGQGHLGGNEDVVTSALQTGNSGAHFAGTYSVGQDGRGNAVVGLQAGCPNWQFTMLNRAHALLTCLNTKMTGSGTIDLQDSTAFSTAALKGNYVFGFSGVGSSAFLAVAAGNWSMDGAGNINTGQMDVNDLSFTAPFEDISLSGTYSVSSSGRGTAVINSDYPASSSTQNFVFYVVNATDIKFMQTNPLPLLAGEVLSQTSGSLTAGTYAFTLGGSDANGIPLAFGGLIPADGNGNVSAGVLDTNYDGSTLSDTLTGTYAVSSSGRGVATLTSPSVGSLPLAFYKAANGNIEFVNLGGNLGGIDFAVSGMAKAQSGRPFGQRSMNGNYAVSFSGTNLGAGEEDISGQLTSDGAGNLSGVLDINSSGSIFQGTQLSGSTYTMTSTGRGTASLNTGTGTFALQTYQIDPGTVLFLDLDDNRVMTGIAEKQHF